MPLETASYINQLDSANPLGSDPIAAGDDHIRLIKAAVKATFPNITGPVTVTQADLNSKVAGAVQKTGDTMTGALVLSGNAASALQAVPLQQLQTIYPVGSIYMNATNNANPASLFGFGTWASFGAGRMPVGFNAADTLFDTAEETGGSKDAIVVSHTHTATSTSTVTDPGHLHGAYPGNGTLEIGSFIAGGLERGGTINYNPTQTATTGITVATTTTNASTGSSGTNANLPPYITVYMWKRTA